MPRIACFVGKKSAARIAAGTGDRHIVLSGWDYQLANGSGLQDGYDVQEHDSI